MSGSQSYPPPGGAPGEPPPPGWAAPQPTPPPAWGPPPGYGPSYPVGPPPPQWAPGMLGAAHKPGAMPLRPLGLGDIYDAAFRIIRFNPKATVGPAVIVAAIAMAIPVLATAVLAAAVDVSIDQGGTEVTTADELGVAVQFGSLALGGMLQSLGLIFVTGMIAHVTAAAAIGRRLSIGEAWVATRGRRWRLVGLSVLTGLIVLVGIAVYTGIVVLAVVLLPTWMWVLLLLGATPLGIALMIWFWIRVCYLPVPAMMIERIGVFAALGRAFRLTRRQFWRTFGIAVLTLILTGVASQIFTVPFSLMGAVAGAFLDSSRYGVLVVVVANALGSVLAAAFVSPFTSAVSSLQYLDQRMRKEAYDVELMTQAGITTS